MKYLFILLSIFLLYSCNDSKEPIPDDNQPTDLFITETYNEIDGTDSNLLSLDIYYNSAIQLKKPVVIYVHGGAWSIGDKSNQIDNKVSLFRSLDYVFVSINYRLSPFPFELTNENRIMFPTHNNDIADAIRWIVDNIDQYGGNSNKIALLGHSAGAHLVALTGTNSTFLNETGLSFSNIKGVASIDTEGYDVLSEIEDENEFYINAFGTDRDLNIQASPIFNIESGVSYPKFFIAKRGNAERIDIANEFIGALEQNGVSVSQIDGSVYDHSGINEVIGKPNETLITDALIAFLEECFQDD